MSTGKHAPKVQDTLQPNLIPMVDVMFLLLLFFLLGADMTQRERADLALPVADQAEESSADGNGEARLVVNVVHLRVSCTDHADGRACRAPGHWTAAIRGHELAPEEAQEFIRREAAAHLEPGVDPLASVQLSALKVIVRADRLAPYGDVNGVIELCSRARVHKLEVGAAQPPRG